MNAIAIDTHIFVKRLREAGLTEPQAEAITDLQCKASEVALDRAKHDFHLDDVATRHDIKELELKIELVRADLKKDIKDMEIKLSETKADLIRWMVGAGILQITIITALLLKLANHL